MDFSYKFYTNHDCMFLPCHENVKDINEFNCLFCYCPLYFLEECNGNYEMKSGIKDCTNCLIPHSKGGYDYINNRLAEENDRRVTEFLEEN